MNMHTAAMMVALVFAGGVQENVLAQSNAKASADADSLCRIGHAQSPIDIRETVAADLPALAFDYRNGSAAVSNSGHAVKAAFQDTMSLRIAGETYRLVEFHYHHPSEHWIDGTAAPLEVHLVHVNAKDSLAVVGVLFREGEVANEALGRMIAGVGRVVSVDPRALLPEDHAYATYPGSLTTGSCSEGVRWLVMEEWMAVSPNQLEALRGLVKENARPVQDHGRRTVKRTRDR